MKKLKLIKVLRPNELKNDELSRIKGGSCQAWLCQCGMPNQVATDVDDTLEQRDRDGYL